MKKVLYYIESRYIRLIRFLGIKGDASVIPDGIYCYVYDEERNKKEPCKDGSYWIKTCKYYRSTKNTGGIACAYSGFYGFDFALYDQCKICSENLGKWE